MLVVVAVAFIALGVLMWNIFYKRNLPPGPTGLPIIGYLHKLARGPYIVMNELSQKYGDIISIQMGSQLAVVLSSKKALNEAYVLQGKQFSHRPSHWKSTKICSLGLTGLAFANFTEEYKRNKRMSMRALQRWLLDKKNFDSVMKRETEKLATLIETEMAEKSYFNPSKYAFNIGASFVLSAIFAEDTQYDDKQIVQLIEVFQKWVFAFVNNPWDVLDYKVLSFFPKKELKQLGEGTVFLNDFALGKIKQYKSNAVNRKCVVSGTPLFDSSSKEGSTEEHLAETAKIMAELLGGGLDAISCLLMWCLLFTAKYPKVIKKCREEILSVVGKDECLSREHERKLPYFVATLYDMLRLSNMGPLSIPRSTSEDVFLRSYLIPKNTVVFANLMALNQDPKEWENPHTLYPEHFLDKNQKMQESAFQKLPSFSTGLRRCPGDRFTIYYMYFMLGTIIKTYSVKMLQPPKDDIPIVGASAKPKPYTLLMSQI